MRNIPADTIIKQNGLGDSTGDIIESFNLDLTSNYRTIRTTRMKMVTDSNDDANIRMPYAFGFINGTYHFFSNGYGAFGGSSPSDSYTRITDVTTTGQFVEQYSDVKEYQGLLYSSGSDSLIKGVNNSWSTAVGGLTAASPHLLEVLGDRLYVTDNFSRIGSIDNSDALSLTGTYSIDLGLDQQTVTPNWSISMLKAFNNTLWIGLINIDTGRGLVIEWDGQTENLQNNRYELESGVMSGCVMNGQLYIMDLQGKLLRYNGAGFSEVPGARLFKKTPYHFDGIDNDNLRFIHPNGMCATDYGTILILLRNDVLNGGYEDTIPSGVYEYDPNIGLYHKYSISTSRVATTSILDYGQQRLMEAGAIFFAKPNTVQTGNDNGVILAGARYYIDATTSAHGVFCDDTIDTTQKWSYMITDWLESERIDDTWQKIYAIYNKLLSSDDRIVVKYRTEKNSTTEATVTWADIDHLSTVVDLSNYSIGDEVQIVQGNGSGKSFKITNITESSGTYTVILDDQMDPLVIGTTAKALFDDWKEIGTARYEPTGQPQNKPFTLSTSNVSPFVQFKICMQFTGKDELRKLYVVNKVNVKE